MKIAYLVSQYPAVNHPFMLREITALRQCGVEVHVASISAPDRPSHLLTEAERPEAAATFCVKAAGLGCILRAHAATFFAHPLRYAGGLLFALGLGGGRPKKTLYGFFYFVEAVIVGDWMRRRGLSHAHVHFSSLVALILVRMFPVTVSNTFHGADEYRDPAGFRLVEKARRSLFVRTISNYGRSCLMQLTGHAEWSRFEVCHLGIDLAALTPRPPRLAPARFRIACVGRLAPVKGHHVLLAAFDRLVREGRDVHLHLVGSGPAEAGLRSDVDARRLRDRVTFEGALDQHGVRRVYENADAAVLASFAEGIPVVLMEAMAMEIPCAATWVNGVPELIRDGVNGLLVPPGNDEALAAALASLIDDPALRLRLGRAGRERVAAEFELHSNTARLAAIFRKWLEA